MWDNSIFIDSAIFVSIHTTYVAHGKIWNICKHTINPIETEVCELSLKSNGYAHMKDHNQKMLSNNTDKKYSKYHDHYLAYLTDNNIYSSIWFSESSFYT
jgi:hypothetical protein